MLSILVLKLITTVRGVPTKCDPPPLHLSTIGYVGCLLQYGATMKYDIIPKTITMMYTYPCI